MAGSDPARFVVVGAGVAGLVVARRLARAGRDVEVLEAADRVGGPLAPMSIAGAVLDAGAETFATRGGAVAALVADLGLADDVVTPEPGGAWLFRGHGAVRLPAAGILGIPADPSAPDVVAAIGRLGSLRARVDGLLPGAVGAGARTLAELVRIRMGRRVVGDLLAPVVRGVYSREAADLPIGLAAPGLVDRMRSTGSLAAAVRESRAAAPAGSLVAGLRGGMHRLADALRRDIDALGVPIHTGVRVDEVAPDHVLAAGGRRDGRVVLAAPRPDGPAGRPVTLVTLVIEAPALDGAPRGTGLLVAAGSGVAARALTHLSAKWSWVADSLGGRHALRLSYDTPPGDAVPTALADASRLFGVALPPPEAATVRTWVRAAPDPAPDDPAGAGLVRVGEPVAGTGLAAVVAHAEATAAVLLSHDSSSRDGGEKMDS